MFFWLDRIKKSPIWLKNEEFLWPDRVKIRAFWLKKDYEKQHNIAN